MLNAKNGRLTIPTGEKDYIRFGNGSKTLVMIPGVGLSAGGYHEYRYEREYDDGTDPEGYGKSVRGRLYHRI